MTDPQRVDGSEGPSTAGSKPTIAEVAAWLRRAAEQRSPVESATPPPPPAPPNAPDEPDVDRDTEPAAGGVAHDSPPSGWLTDTTLQVDATRVEAADDSEGDPEADQTPNEEPPAHEAHPRPASQADEPDADTDTDTEEPAGRTPGIGEALAFEGMAHYQSRAEPGSDAPIPATPSDVDDPAEIAGQPTLFDRSIDETAPVPVVVEAAPPEEQSGPGPDGLDDQPAVDHGFGPSSWAGSPPWLEGRTPSETPPFSDPVGTDGDERSSWGQDEVAPPAAGGSEDGVPTVATPVQDDLKPTPDLDEVEEVRPEEVRLEAAPTADTVEDDRPGTEPPSKPTEHPDPSAVSSRVSLFDLDLAELAARARASASAPVTPAPGPTTVRPKVIEPAASRVEVDPDATDVVGTDIAIATETGDSVVLGDVELDEEAAVEQPGDESASTPVIGILRRPRRKAMDRRYPRGQLKERIGILRRVRAMLGVVVLTVLLGVAAGAAIGTFLLLVALAVRSAITSS